MRNCPPRDTQPSVRLLRRNASGHPATLRFLSVFSSLPFFFFFFLFISAERKAEIERVRWPREKGPTGKLSEQETHFTVDGAQAAEPLWKAIKAGLLAQLVSLESVAYPTVLSVSPYYQDTATANKQLAVVQARLVWLPFRDTTTSYYYLNVKIHRATRILVLVGVSKEECL